MSINQILEIGVAASLALFCLRGILPEIRHYLRMRRSRMWPTVQGVIQTTETLEPNSGKYMRLPWRVLLGYTYVVNDCPHWGYFALATEDSYSAQKLGKQVVGQPVFVKFDPKNPDISILANKQIDGRRIVQYPVWLDG